MSTELFNKDLPKWPCLLVSGKKVTSEQAAVIIIRTEHIPFFSNDHDFEAKVNEVFGFKYTRYGAETPIDVIRAEWDHNEQIKTDLGHLDLEYLGNSQIMSAYIGGPHGWINWNGDVFCNDYNIGKWPSVREVYEEWQKIAVAFPFLELRSQLLSQENCENGDPVVEFLIKDGQVEIKEPESLLVPSVGPNFHRLCLHDHHREHGCSIQDLERALELTRKSLANG